MTIFSQHKKCFDILVMYAKLKMPSLKMFPRERLRDVDCLQASAKLATGSLDVGANCNENFPHSGCRRDVGSPAGWRDAGLGQFAEQLASGGSKTQPYKPALSARKRVSHE